MLRYAATPICLILALLNARSEGAVSVCGPMDHASLLGGMATMYLVMAIFHAGPWLRMFANRLIIKDL